MDYAPRANPSYDSRENRGEMGSDRLSLTPALSRGEGAEMGAGSFV
ncbi:MAG TPA: hypothetical protein PK878_14650 [bacterium]|nr:hypothetical protein [Candidatus Omnitrophota bacterium]HOJ61519.1 hypothetical protein [bacterium]HOL93411.1 hypothetical protein [bacterium]HPP02771.1 hypothetical protein [bacterium]HXK95646.1 hypothetical protein [bacterium]